MWVFAIITSLLVVFRVAAGILGMIPNPIPIVEAAALTLTTIGFSMMGALIIVRTDGNRVGWLMMLLGFVLADPFRTYLEVNYAALQSDLSFSMYFAVWTQGWFFFLILYAICWIILYFPDGYPPTPRWNLVTSISLLTFAQFILVYTFQPTLGESDIFVENPIALLSVSAEDTISGFLFGIGLIFLGISSLISIFVRYRRAGSLVRTQIKWLLYAGVISFLAIGFRLATYNPEINDWTGYLLVISLLVLIISISIAILRYRLYDIDIIIRRTLQYSLLTGILALVFLGGVVVLQGVFQVSTGSGDSPLVTVLSTLLIAALFNPVRVRTQNWIDHRFYRTKYDAEKALTDFAETARDEVDINLLTGKLIQIVANTMNPKDVRVFLKSPHEDQ